MGNELDLFKILLDSGPVVKFVIILLILGSVLSWTIVFQKFFFFKKMRDSNKKFIGFYSSDVTFTDIYQHLDSYPESSFTDIFKEGFLEMEKIKQQSDKSSVTLTEFFDSHGVEAIERSIKKGIHSSQVRQSSKVTLLATIGNISPFVGLFGTVWGIINAFQGLAVAGSASLETVAPGIAEALVATAIGLAVAIPAVWFYNKYSNQISIHESEMDSFAQDLINNIQRKILMPNRLGA